MLFKFPSSGQNIDDAAVFTQALQGNSLKPFAPANLHGTRNATGDILIKWLRRPRIFISMREAVGAPLVEEEEVWWVDLLNDAGSLILKSFRLKFHTSETQPILWEVYKDVDSRVTIETTNLDGTVSVAAPLTIGHDVYVQGLQLLRADGMISCDISSGNPGLVLFQLLSEPDNGTAFRWAFNDASLATVASASSGGGTTTRPFISVKENNNMSIERIGDSVRFYVNYSGPNSIPIFTSPYPASGSYRPWILFQAEDTTSTAKALRCRITRADRSFLVPTQLQTDLYGGLKSIGTMRTRVTQESPIVGRGFYAEKLI